MKKRLSILILLSSFVSLWANDGAYYASGNHLIPITETDIRVQKEILTLRKAGDDILVDVYYEFYNPVGPKTVLVGFEAPLQGGDVSFANYYPEHGYISDFTVTMNNQRLSYNVAQVTQRLATFRFADEEPDYKSTPQYYTNGQIKSLTKKQLDALLDSIDFESSPFNYVYYFNANFQKGVNIVRHTYRCKLSVTVEQTYYFKYILTAANRWANNGIDDFTLNIDMGDCESFLIPATFFKDAGDWKNEGKGRKNMTTVYETRYAVFHILNGNLTFHRNNFHPDGELSISKPNMMHYIWNDYDSQNTPAHVLEMIKKQRYNLYKGMATNGVELKDFTRDQRQILRNVPFAYRGFVFKTKKLQDFFNSTKWYVPNPNYKVDMNELTEDEQEWVEYWSK